MAKNNTVAVRFTGDVSALRRATGEAEGALGGFAKKAGTVLKAGLAAAGAIGAAALAKGFQDALANEAALDKTAAAFGLSAAESERQGKIAGDLYADAYGDSLGQVSEAVATVTQQLGQNLDPGQIEDLTANTLDFAKAFDVDVSEAVNAAGFLVKNQLVGDGEEAMDLLTSTFQRLPAGVRDEVLEATQEYSTFFADLGIDGAEAFALIENAAEKGGKFGVDKVGDALKELTIRATDMSTASVTAYETAGLSAEDMAARFLAGGDTARGALDDLVDGLADIEDPVERANAAIGLFGTPLEDLSVTEIPEFLRQLDGMGDDLVDVAGAADKMGDTLNDNVATKIESFKRTALQGLANLVGTHVIPAIEKLVPVFQEKVLPVIKEFGGFIVDTVVPALEDLWAYVQEKILPTYADFAKKLEADVLPALKDLWTVFKDDVLPILQNFYKFVAEKVLPIVLAVVAFLLQHMIPAITAWVSSIATAVEKIGGFLVNVRNAFGAVVTKAQEVASQIKGAFDGVVSFISGLPGRITSAASGMWNGIKTSFQNVLNAIIRGWNNLRFPKFNIPSVDIPGLGKIGGGSIGGWDLPNISPVSLATGGVVSRPTLAMVGDAGIGNPEIVAPEKMLRRIMQDVIGVGGPQVIQLVVDGRVLAQTVNDHNADRARRNGAR